MTRVVSIVGARPQFVKAAVVSRAFRDNGEIQEILVHTGQHYDYCMNKVFFDELRMPAPDHHLDIGSGSHGQQTGRMMEGIERVLLEENPDWVLVYGDTNSTLAGALAASKLRIRVAHVEAGLRSFDRDMPEEINRVLTDHVSEILFAPTETAVSNAVREGISKDRIRLVGDVMYDAALYYGDQATAASGVLEQLSLTPGDYILATIHRAESTDSPARLARIVEGLVTLAASTRVVIPLHPRTRKALDRDGLFTRLSEAALIVDPLGYFDMLCLEKNARAIVTDSGGVQKEAFFHRVPCVTVRDRTEWVELIESGWNRLVPPETFARVDREILNLPQGTEGELFGGGHAAEKIARILERGGSSRLAAA